jgi:hypothetical protein
MPNSIPSGQKPTPRCGLEHQSLGLTIWTAPCRPVVRHVFPDRSGGSCLWRFHREYELSWIELGLHLEPCLAYCGHVGRSCSAAGRLFLKAKPRWRRIRKTDNHPLFRQASLELSQRDVRLPTQPSRDPIPVSFQCITFVATELLRTHATGASPTCEKSACRTDAH